ncbi:MAG TPA: sugar-binding protein [Chloroflexota bacterium]|nr:sugar-binding protein [Chloroflexota bacterium]
MKRSATPLQWPGAGTKISRVTPRLILLLVCVLAGLAGSRGASAQAASGPTVTLNLVGGAPFNRFMVGDPITVQVAVSNPTPTPQTLTRGLTVVDYFGNATTLLTGTITLAAGQVLSSTTTLATPSAGYFELHAALYGQAPAALSTAIAPYAVLRPQKAGLDSQSAFGINGGLTQFYGNTAQALDDAAAAMAAAGIHYDREEFNWNTIEPKAGSGQFSFARADRAVIAAHQSGIQILGLLDYWGNLPAPQTTSVMSTTGLLTTITGCTALPACSYTPQGDALFARYAATVAARYAPDGALAREQGWTDHYGISDWEVWNEPSTTSFWRHDFVDYGARFAALYKTAAAAIRTVEPDARLMYTMSGHTIDSAVKATHVRSDIIAVHTYSGGLDPDAALASPTLPRGGQGTPPAALGTVVAQGLPVWITETGYTTDGTITNNQQAEYLVRSFTDYLAEGARKNFWFKFHEDGQGTENEYGITSFTNAPKPAYVAYATMADHLQDATFATSISLGAAVRGDIFSRRDGSLSVVLWSTAEPGTLVIPAASGASFTADDLMNNPTGSQANGVLTVPLSNDPVFLTATGISPAALASLLAHAPITGINPVGVGVAQAPGLSNGLPNVLVTVTARIDQPISGTVTLALPDGWTAPIVTQRFPTLQPGQSRTLSFRLNSDVNHPDDQIGATATTPLGLTNTGSAPVTPYALTYGHPAIDGSLATWSGASVAGLIDLGPDKIVGIPGWTPQNLSARIFTMWDEQYFYLAADVQDETFDYAPIGYNMYKGDSMQFGWGMDPDAYLRDMGKNKFNVTAGLTHQGPANFQYNLLGPWTDMKEAIKLDPTTGHLIYTLAIPWSRLGNYTPKVGKQFAFNLLINQNEHGARIGWIQFAPGIGIGFHPSEWPLWTVIGGNPAAGLRLGGFTAPRQGALNFTLPVAHGTLVIHNGGLRTITLQINGTPITFGPGGTSLPAGGDTTLDVSRYLHTGANTVQAVGSGPNRASVAVLSFFQ